MGFDLRNYETVKQRKKRFYRDNKDGRIIVELLNEPTILDYALFKATIYRNVEDQTNKNTWSTGYAMEIRDKELSKKRSGGTYESVNYSSWTENCEESAIGRALDNAGYAGNDKCSRKEMEKVERMNKTQYTKPKNNPPKKQQGSFKKAIEAINRAQDSKGLDTICTMLETRAWTEREKKELENMVELKLSELLESAV